VSDKYPEAVATKIEAEQALVNANRDLIEPNAWRRRFRATLACVWGEEKADTRRFI
jgi:hypothetical protein